MKISKAIKVKVLLGPAIIEIVLFDNIAKLEMAKVE